MITGCLAQYQILGGLDRVMADDSVNRNKIQYRLEKEGCTTTHTTSPSFIAPVAFSVSTLWCTYIYCVSSSRRSNKDVCPCGANCAMPWVGPLTRSPALLWASSSRSTCWMWLRWLKIQQQYRSTQSVTSGATQQDCAFLFPLIATYRLASRSKISSPKLSSLFLSLG